MCRHPDASAVASVSAIRSRFPALERTENGRPRRVLRRSRRHAGARRRRGRDGGLLLHHNANTHWVYPTSVETDARITAARGALADFLGGDPSEIAFGANMTTLTFHVARALARGWAAGDEVVVTELDHHANVDPWRALEKDRGVVVKAAPLVPGRPELDLEALGRLLGKRTRLVAVGAASNAVGTINDVARVAALARANGSRVFVDAVHYAPHALVDVKALGADFLACSPYKFYGPHAGVLWGRSELLEELDVPKLRPAPEEAPDRLETGTQNHEGIVGCGAAVDFLASLAGDGGGTPSPPRADVRGASRARRGPRRPDVGRPCGDPGRHALRPAARRAPNADRRVRRGGPRPGRRRPRARPAGRLRVARRLLRDDARRAARAREGRPRARGMRVLHDRGRGRPSRLGRSRDRPRQRRETARLSGSGGWC